MAEPREGVALKRHCWIAQKIVQIRGALFVSPQRGSIVHVLPRISPQLHHKNTTANHQYLRKPPAKSPTHRKKKTHSLREISPPEGKIKTPSATPAAPPAPSCL